MQEPTPQERTEAFAKDLARLLSAADMPVEQKQAWAQLVVLMDPKDLIKFHAALQSHVIAQSEDSLGEYLNDLKELRDRYGERLKDATGRAADALNAIDSEL